MPHIIYKIKIMTKTTIGYFLFGTVFGVVLAIGLFALIRGL